MPQGECANAVSTDLGKGKVAPGTRILAPPGDTVVIDQHQFVALISVLDKEIADRDRLPVGHDNHQIVTVLFERSDAFRRNLQLYDRGFVELEALG